MNNTKEFKEAIVEVLDIIKHMDEEYVELIPLELIKKLNIEKSDTYKSNIDYTIPLEDNDLKPDTKNIIAMIYLEYICPEDEREEYILELKQNEKQEQEEMKQRYNTNVFENGKNKGNTAVQSLVKVEEKNIFQKIFDKIFKINKY